MTTSRASEADEPGEPGEPGGDAPEEGVEGESGEQAGGLKPPPMKGKGGLPSPPPLKASASVDDLVVARRSEATGVTYFLPDDAVLGQFEDMASMSRDDLLLLLEDANGRLEAAQMLIERFGAPVVSEVLAASETMHASEVAALAKFLESRADGLEGELVRCVEGGGPSTTYIASHALVNIRSTSAIPVLLEAMRDSGRQGNRQALANTLSGYGDKLLPPLTRIIKRDGHDEAILELLGALERHQEGTLGKLARDRNRKVREAAKQAKQAKKGS